MTATIAHPAASLDDIRVETARQMLASCPRPRTTSDPTSAEAFDRDRCPAVRAIERSDRE
jgi:hypothetical protein